MPIKRKEHAFSREKACSMKSYCKLSCNSVIFNSITGSQRENSPTTILAQMGGTQLLSVIGKFCQCTGSQGVVTPRRSQSSEQSNLKQRWCQGGQQGKMGFQFKEAKNMICWRHWHCKKVSITSFKQISLAKRWKSDDTFVHLVCVREQNWYVFS